MDFKETLSVFFGLTERTRKSSIADLQKQLKEAYARVKELQETLYSLNNSSIDSSDIDNFVDKATRVNYPFLDVSIENSTPPVSMRVSVEGTSFFYSDHFSGYEDPKFVYADAPQHFFTLRMSRSGGLISLTNDATDLSTRWNGYDIADDLNFSTRNPYGHPHASGSQSHAVVQATGNALCFGTNLGVPELIKNASTLSDVGMLLRKLYHWLTEIYLGSVYHSDTAAIRIASGDVFDEMEDIGHDMFSTYRTVVPEVRDYFKEYAGNLGYDYDNSVKKPMGKLLSELLRVYCKKPRLLASCLNNLNNHVSAGELTPEKAMCLYQFVTAFVLMETIGHRVLPTAVVNAIGSDLFSLPSAWYMHSRMFHAPDLAALRYPKYFLHYFDGFEYAVNGGY